MNPSRREFLLDGARGITLAAASLSFPSVLAKTAAAAAATNPNGRILILVQLSGGNDGLNTVVPYANEQYRRLRPTLGIKRDEVLKLDDHVGLCPQLRGLMNLREDGWLSVVQGVGYPNPNRSHFQSMDIWHCADPSLANTQTGWLGRALERDQSLHALHLDDEPLPLALRAERAEVPSVRTIESFRLPEGGQGATGRTIESMLEACDGASAQTPSAAHLDDLQFIHRTAVTACRNARRLENMPADSSRGYPSFALARRLREIARLIAADFGPRIYYTSLGGFDTHARQNTVHPNLMSELGDSVQAFYRDLREKGLADRVLLMTFSEFGRRAAENASLGTDHGAAAPLFVAGPAVQAGVVGRPPDLVNLVDGDVPHTIDFRSVYATVLERWLKIPAAPILGQPFEHVPIVA